MAERIILAIILFLIGMLIGGFMNICIDRIPKGEKLLRNSCRCGGCGDSYPWYLLIPIFGFLVARGKCPKCSHKLSIQYPIIAALNGALYILVSFVTGFGWDSMIYCLMTSALLTLSIIDFRTYEIPVGFNIFLGFLGVMRCALNFGHIVDHLIGLVAISAALAALYYLSGGRAIGGGDVKLMAAAGLLLGWKLIILAFVIGVVAGAIIHVIRMKVSDAEAVLALGPYLSVGIWIAALWGDVIINAYLGIVM